MMCHCRNCGIQWDIPIRLPMPVEVAAKVMAGWSICPYCAGPGLCGPLKDGIPSVRDAAEALADGPVCVLHDAENSTDEEAMAAWNGFIEALSIAPRYSSEAPDNPGGGRVGCRECGEFHWDRDAGTRCPSCGEPLVEVSVTDEIEDVNHTARGKLPSEERP